MNIKDLKPATEPSNLEKRNYIPDASYYNSLICMDCKINKAELIRGTDEYLCAECFKKWALKRNENEKNEKNNN